MCVFNWTQSYCRNHKKTYKRLVDCRSTCGPVNNIWRKFTYHLSIFSPISKFPSIRRDLAFIVQKDISVGRIESKIREVFGNLLIELVIFDVYLGAACEKDAKSVALGLTLQDSSRTLVDEEVVDIIERVIKTLRSDLGAKLRE